MKEHPLYPEVENPVVFALGIIILFGLGLIVCVPLVIICCSGPILALSEYERTQEVGRKSE